MAAFNIDTNHIGRAITYSDLQSASGYYNQDYDYNSSIFDRFSQISEEMHLGVLNEQLDQVNDNNGCVRGLWNVIKDVTGLGVSKKDCEAIIESYKNGEISYEEAEAKIQEYSSKQDSSLNLFSNIVSSVAAIGVAAAAAVAIVASGGTATPLVLAAIGAGTGAVAKAGFKFADRATNKVQGDALDAKQIAKDGLSGAVTGGIATLTMGTAGTAPSVGRAIIGCAKTGVKTGALSCGSNYVIDCAFDEDKDFNLAEFTRVSAEGAVIGGTVGAIMGGINSTMHATGTLKSGCNLKSVTAAGGASSKDVAANQLCTAEYKILTDRIRSMT